MYRALAKCDRLVKQGERVHRISQVIEITGDDRRRRLLKAVEERNHCPAR